MRDLITQLAEAPQSFDLFQAISLLERSEPDRAAVGTSLGLDEALRFSADVTLSFMPSDVSAVLLSKREGPPLTLSTSALSLAGAHGPYAYFDFLSLDPAPLALLTARNICEVALFATAAIALLVELRVEELANEGRNRRVVDEEGVVPKRG